MPSQHVVRQGDCISSIAAEHGFHPDTIWNDPANAELKKTRKNPNVLYEGDVVVVPDPRLKEESRPSDQRHKFVHKGVPELLCIVLVDEYDEPRKNVRYTLTIDGLHTRQGTTDGDGQLKEPISPNARQGRLIVGEGEDQEEYALDLGHLDPVTEISGVQMRLWNLGYDCGPPDGVHGPRTIDAIKKFQLQRGLTASGELDDATRQKLVEIHGS